MADYFEKSGNDYANYNPDIDKVADKKLKDAAMKLEAKGYRIELFDNGFFARKPHIINLAWVKVQKIKDNYSIFYGADLNWKLYYPALLVLFRIFTLNRVNKQTYSDTFEAMYGQQIDL